MRIDKTKLKNIMTKILNKKKEIYNTIKEKFSDLYEEYKEPIVDTAGYFFDLGLFILMYGVPYCIAVHIASIRFGWNIPFNVGWIFVVGILMYTLKEEMPRAIRNSFPQKSNNVIE